MDSVGAVSAAGESAARAGEVGVAMEAAKAAAGPAREAARSAAGVARAGVKGTGRHLGIADDSACLHLVLQGPLNRKSLPDRALFSCNS